MVKLEKRSDSCNTRSISNCVEETQRLNVYFETALGRAKPQTANKIDKRSYKNSRLKSFLPWRWERNFQHRAYMYFNSKLDSTRNILTGPNFRRWFSSFDRSSRKGRKQRFIAIFPMTTFSLSLYLCLSQTLYRSAVRKTSRAQTTHPGEIFRFLVAEFSIIIPRAKEVVGFRFRSGKKIFDGRRLTFH